MFKTGNLYQNNEKWKNVKLGNSSETIGGWGGLLTSITMMLNGIGYDETPYTVNEKLKKAGGFLKALPIPPFLTYIWPNCIYRDITRCEKSDAPIAKIDAAVAAGKPVILQVDSSRKRGLQTHFVLVKKKKGNDYVLYDPQKANGDGPNKEVLLTQRYKFNSGKLESEISAILWFDFDKSELPKPPEVTKKEVPAEKYPLYAAEERLVLRAKDSMDSYPRKCLFMGTELISLEPQDTAKPKLGVKGQWIQVQDPNGDQGYVSALFVTSELSKLLPPTKTQPSRRKWCLKNVSLQHPVIEMRWYSPEGRGEPIPNRKPVKSFDTLFKDTVVSVLESAGTMPGWVRIMYEETYLDVKDWVTVRVTGLANNDDLDDYREDEREEFRNSGVNILPGMQTESSTDGQQDLYINVNPNKGAAPIYRPRYNLCGEFSVAFVTGKKIDTVLSEWEQKSKAMYDSMVGNADKPLEPAHMQNLFGVHGIQYEPYRQKDKIVPLAASHLVRQTPDSKDAVSVVDNRRASPDLQTWLKEYYFLTNLKINTRTGDLEPAYSAEERNHWVVLDCVTRDGSRVELYNPFPNRREEYSFGEFYRSVGSQPGGWWIKRKVNLPSAANQKAVTSLLRVEQAVQPPTFKVATDNQTENKGDAEQYLRIRGESSTPKTKLCGEFCVTFILGQSLDTSLKHWMEKQAEQAGLRELATLLQAYGFNRRKYILQKDAKPELGKYYVVPNDERNRPSDPDGYFKSFSIDTVLEYWKGVQPVLYNSILGDSKNEPTGPDDLITILKAYGYGRDDYSYYRPGSQESFGYAPGRDAEVLAKTHFLLAGVNIHGTTGRLQPSGVPHWVVVTKISPRGNLVGGNGGWVELYNPFPNCWEEYSYREFMDAFRGSSAGSTLWIKKDISPVFTVQSLSPAKSKEKNPGRNVTAQGNQKGASGQKGDKKDQDKDKHKRNAGSGPIDDNPPMDANRVVCARLGVISIPWEIGRWIGDTADGDRFFAETLAEALCESGILSIQEKLVNNKKIRTAVLTDPEFSDTFELTIKKNMDRLASSQRAGEPASRVTSAVLPLFTRSTIEEIKKTQKIMPVHAYQKLADFRAWTLSLASKFSDPLETEIKGRVENLLTAVPVQREEFKVCSTILTRSTSQAFEEEIKKIDADSKTIKKIKAIWKSKRQDEISLSEIEEWARGLTTPRKNIYRVKKWGDQGMIDTSVLIAQGQSSNFQAVSLYNEATGFGAISNYLIIPREDVLRLEALQVEDEYVDKRDDNWLHQKMNWLCQHRGSIYMFADEDSYKGEWRWRRADGIRWGTLALGGNLVQVVGTPQTFPVKLPSKPKAESVRMVQLQGFTPRDWDRPLDELLAEGLVHRCFCVYQGDDLGDSPKGIVYSPFWSLEYWEFMPKPKGVPAPTALWIPFDYLEDPPEGPAINSPGNSG